jgi:TonB family protein
VSLAAGAVLGAASLSGTIYDQTGAVVPGAKVTMFDANNVATSVNSNETGQFRLPSLMAGVHRLDVEKPGFKLIARKGIKLDTASSVRMNLVLVVGQVAETITVTGKGVPQSDLTPKQVRSGGQVAPPKLVKMVRPVYPEDLKARGIHGEVTLEAVIQRDGALGNLTLIGPADQALAEAAADTVRQWRYAPVLLNGQPVETVTSITIAYELKQ